MSELRPLPVCFAAVLVCAGVGGALRVSEPAPAPQVTLTMPFILRGVGTGQHFVERGDIRADIGCDTEARVVEVLWRYGLDGFMTDAFSLESQRWPVTYWPTDVCVVPNGTWLVSGKDPVDGTTLIERWDFADDGEFAVALAATQDETTEELEYAWTLPVRASVTEIYREATAGRDVVDLCFVNPGKPHTVFVRFQDSQDIYELDIVTQRYSLAASPTLASARLLVPRTGNLSDWLWSARHATRGFVFVLASWHGPSVRTVVLCDADEDGVLDTASVVGAYEWCNSDWADPGCYLEHFP